MKTILFVYILNILSFDVMAVNKATSITLKQAVSKVLDQNLRVKLIDEEKKLAKYEYELKKLSFYLPDLTLSGSYDASETLFNVPNNSSMETLSQGRNQSNKNVMVPNSEIALEIAAFNIFNSGRDKDKLTSSRYQYLSTKLDHEASLRDIIYEITSKFYELLTKKELLEVAKTKRDFSKSLFSLTKQLKKINKVDESDIVFSEGEVLTAEKDFKQALADYNITLIDLNKLFYEPLNQKYIPIGKLNYKPATFKYTDLVKKLSSTPTIMKSYMSLQSTKFLEKSSWKDYMGAPKITLSGYKLSHGFSGSNDANISSASPRSLYYDTSSGNGNFDLKAEISFTFPIWGENGFLNLLGRKQSKLNIKRAEVDFIESKQNTRADLKIAYLQLLSKEEEIRDLEKSQKNNSKLLDLTFAKYRNGKSSRSDLKTALDELNNTNISLLNAIKSHIDDKISLAKLMGSDDNMEGFER